MMDEYEFICNFCMSVSKGEPCSDGPPPNPPETCVHCHVTRCRDCSTFLKGDKPVFCYGCGKVSPRAEASFVRSDKTAAIYMEKEWLKRNMGKDADGPYMVSTGRDRDDENKWSQWLVKDNEDRSQPWQQIREFTEEEQNALKRQPN